MIEHAVKAVQSGLWIFPVQDGEKTPHVTTPPYTIRWSEVATNDIRRVIDLWSAWPNANIGVACAQSGLLVVDCDVPKRSGQLVGTRYEYLHELKGNSPYGDMADGESVYDQVCWEYGREYPELHRTYRVRTGSGGLHYYYRWPNWRKASQASLVKGLLDIRCNGGTRGGYVLGAGSRTSSGDYIPVWPAHPVADAPDWLFTLCTLCRERVMAQPVRSPYHQPGGGNYSGLRDAVMFAQPGNRNETLNWSAHKMRSDGCDLEQIEAELYDAAIACGLTEVEIRDTLRSK